MELGTVLVIDDERDLLELLRSTFEREGFRVLGARDGEAGLALALSRSPDLILLDRMMPGPDGIELCRRLRSETRTAHVPVILLTAKAAEEDRVMGFDAGADDYVTKPFSLKELVARVRARLRRPAPAPGGDGVPSVVRNGDLVIDTSRGEASFGGRPLRLAEPDVRMLQFLAAVPGRVMFRRSAPPGALLLGSLARRESLLSREQLREALAAQDRDPARRLGELLVERFVLSGKDLDRLLDGQARAFGAEGSGAPLGRLLVERRLATEFQVREALRLQGRMVEAGLYPVPRVGDILLKRGAISSGALAAALELQNFVLYRCPSCGARIALAPEAERGSVICPPCGGEVPRLFAKIAGALHRVLEEEVSSGAVPVPEELLAAAEDPARRFGKYVLLEEIGRGGAGVVWRAWQLDVNRVVALKRLLPPPEGGREKGDTPFGHPEAVKRFFSEARAIAELDHPGIVPLYDYGIAERSFYAAMKLIEGESLDSMLHGAGGSREDLPGRRLPFRKAAALARDVALALDYSHRRGVCHRDVKPGNVLVDRAGRPCLIDFGLARVARIGDPAYAPGIVVGTPFYMPPEQAAGDMEQVDGRSDVYSLGAVLYEMLSGFVPYAGLSSDATFDILTTRAPEPLDKIAPDVPAVLVRVVSTAMARDKESRYPDAGRMADDLGRFLEETEG